MLRSCEDAIIVGSFVSTQYRRVTDRQTDRDLSTIRKSHTGDHLTVVTELKYFQDDFESHTLKEETARYMTEHISVTVIRELTTKTVIINLLSNCRYSHRTPIPYCARCELPLYCITRASYATACANCLKVTAARFASTFPHCVRFCAHLCI